MRTTLLVLLLKILPVSTVAQSTPQSDQSTRSEAKRGDHVMGFSHEATTHHFHLLKDGGEIVVTVNDPNDKTSVEEIRTHLNHIVSVFEWKFQCPDADSRREPARHGDNGAPKVQHSLHIL